MEDEGFLQKEADPPKVNPGIKATIFLELCCIIATVVIICITSGDCEKPVRLWLQITIGILAFHSLFLVASSKLGEKFASMAMAVNTILLSFLFLWMLTGLVWIYHDDDCINDFENGYYLVESMVLLYFGMFILALLTLLGVTCLVCMGSFYINSLINEGEEEDL